MQHAMHVVTYYKHRAAGNVCEDAVAAFFYEWACTEEPTPTRKFFNA